ncbi:hypothetical protein D9M68_794150 [compost metagenome]
MRVEPGDGVARRRVCKAKQAMPTVMADKGEFSAQTTLPQRVAVGTQLRMATVARAYYRMAGTGTPAHVRPAAGRPHPGENDLLHRPLPRRTLSQMGACPRGRVTTAKTGSFSKQHVGIAPTPVYRSQRGGSFQGRLGDAPNSIVGVYCVERTVYAIG